MCTLAVAFRAVEGLPLVVAANRDEALDRPASGPALRSGRVPYLAPRDERAGGTWLGLNAHGLFVGITNRFGAGRDPQRASRGALVTQALEVESARELHAQLARLAPARFNPFHLLYADRDAAFETWCDGAACHQRTLEPGLHVLTERSHGAADDALREPRVRETWRAADVRDSSELERLREVLVIHDPVSRIGGTCVHAEELNYGTRSSLLLAIGELPSASRMLWAEGRPCEHPHGDVSALLERLHGR